MEIRQLKYFVTSAELLNFTEAADRCFVTQGTLSQQIKQLENELDILLFDRIGKRVRLTAAGKLFLPYARQTILQSESAKLILSDFKELKTGTICVGVSYALTSYLTKGIAKFSRSYPQIHIEIILETSEVLLKLLDSGKVDFILSYSDIVDERQFEYNLLFQSSLSFVTNRNHSLSQKKQVIFSQLKNEPLALPTKGFNTRRYLDKLYEKENITPKIGLEVNDIATLLEIVKTGLWSTILSTSALMENTNDLIYIPIKEKGKLHNAYIIWAKSIYRKKAAILLAESIN
ncbi:LysR substrate-binding domain-containing protein [Rhizosphaericola mali]|uniref:LysR family transcriptional regulator n=1 Tax=Rhizosphaericola mali TaxID=2545455 RepID=A0A5P2G1W8_9BACT|nr:LysR substrate-binding domain-containing protein [Rhizosphaericola mali]QES88708.1 LysR family transcriptional regulator [Rhizosphaericola mali]